MAMAASIVKLLFGVITVSIAMWMVFLLLLWIASRILGASVKFQFGGWTSFRDIAVTFKKGAVESILVGEIKLGVSFLLKDPKLQISICGIEVVTRPSSKSQHKAKRKRKPRSPGKGKGKGSGKWITIANLARFFSLSLKDIVVKTPKATSQVKELKVDISKDGGSKPSFFFNLNILPISVHIGEQQLSCDQSPDLNNEGSTSTNQCPFSCEGFSLSCEFGHDRELGVAIHNVDINIGEISLSLNEEMLSKKKKSSDASSQTDKVGSTIDSTVINEPQKDQAAVSPVTKYTSMFPEKVCFNLPKVNLGFTHRELDVAVENNIMGIQLKIMKSKSIEDGGEKTRLDGQLDFSEIHILREAGTSLLEIKKIDIVSFVHIPTQPTAPIRAEIDVKLGGTQCNVIITRLTPWLRMQSSKKKSMVLREETPKIEKPKSAGSKKFMWTYTVSAPEMKIMLYNINGLPLYHACSQSTHVFANNISSAGTSVHMELGELNLHVADENQECLKESIFSLEPNSGSLLHVVKVSLDWGKKDMDTSQDAIDRFKLALSIDVTGMGIYFTFKRVESLIVTAMSFQALLKPLLPGKKSTPNQSGHASKSSGKGMRLLKFNLERCSVNFYGHASLESAVVPDPKRVNYGSQGGRVVISVSADGTERTASIVPTVSDESKRLKYSISIDIFHLSLCVNKEKQSKQLEVERAKSMYQEYQDEDRPCTKVALFDIQNAKFVQRSGGLKEIAVCSLFSATDIAVRWEPDVHLSLFELGLQMKLLVHNQKLEQRGNKQTGEPSSLQDEPKKESPTLESGNLEKQKKKESIFALDVELLTISAEAGDGVEAMVQVQSIFSENARIGVLLEGLMLCFCGARIVKSSRMQISRIPSTSSDAKAAEGTIWDWRVQALDVHICMPYRLQLRAIDDAVEEMLRALKLVTAAQTKLIFPIKKTSSSSKKPSSKKFGRLRFCIRKLTADIEEEPLQGWLDEHYHLMKREASELAVRLELLDDFISANHCPKTDEVAVSTSEKKVIYDGVEIDVQDPSAIQKLREDLYRKSFQSYYSACQKVKQSEGSGACREGFQAGFKPSITRTSVISVSATEFDVTLKMIDGGEDGMIEVVKKLDPVARENNIPFARLYGSNILLDTGTLDVFLRDYTFPLLSATRGKCEGRLVLAQQATSFQPQVSQDVYIGKWRKVQLLRSLAGTTPPMKTFLDLPIFFQKGVVSYGVGYEPVFADVSYAFTVALRRAHLSLRGPEVPQPPKKEKSLPWWDEMRNYIHGNTTLFFSETKFHILATSDPYEKLNELQITSGSMEIQQSDGRVYLNAKDFRIYLSSLESMISNPTLKLPAGVCGAFLVAPVFIVEVLMDWECESGSPLNHFLFSLPDEGKPREKVFDPFRSTGLSLRWIFSLRPLPPTSETQSPSGSNRSDNSSTASLTLNVGAHDIAWMIKFCFMMYLPPHKLRFFSRWPRFGVPRIPRSGNLSLDRVITDFMLRFDATATCIKHMPLDDDDPAKGLTFTMTKLKYEMYSSRCQQKYTFECFRDPLDLVYQGVDVHMLKALFDKEDCNSVAKLLQIARKGSQTAAPIEKNSSEKSNTVGGSAEKHRDDGFFISSDYFSIRRQAPKADSARLLAWQEAGKKDMESSNVKSEIKNGSDGDEHARSDPSDDEGFDVVIADNCQRVLVYGLKLLWNLENRDAVWSWVGGLSKAFEPQKRSPSRQYTQRKLLEEKQQGCESEKPQEDASKNSSTSEGSQSSSQHVEASGSHSSPLPPAKMENPSTPPVAPATNDIVSGSEEEERLHFMVNVIEPQFNLHSEEANGRFLLAAASGRVLARSFNSVLQVGSEMIEQALGTDNVQIQEKPENNPEMTWKRMEFSVMLEHVQAHVAPTDVDPGAGIQWLPKIRRKSPRVKRTGALLERVFMPCDMFFRYTRHKGWSPELKVKPLKELAFNSHDITATMTSRQFQVMLDVLTNLLFARVPKPRKSSLTFPGEDDEDMGEEADEVVPDGVEEVELARIALERKEQNRKLLLGDIKKMSVHCDSSSDHNPEKEGDLWMITGGRSLLVQGLKKELANAQKARKEASASLRVALQKAAQIRLMEKEKNKSPSYAMRVSVQITKVAWSMLLDGKPIAETEINDMIYDFERDYRDVGVAQFTTKFFVVRNCLPNAKSDTLLSPWNPPPEWGKKVMLRVDAKQGAPKDGNSTIELFQVEIYPLKIHLTETMYRMMWGYLFPEEEQDSLRRQEVWKVSTTVGARRGKKGSIDHLTLAKDLDLSTKSGSSSPSQSANAESALALKSPKSKGNIPGLRRTSSFDRTWEETVAESIANELVLQAQSSTKSDSLVEQQDESSKNKLKDSKPVKSGKPAPEEKKGGKVIEEKKPARPRKMMEFHNIKISQVELLVTYEGSRFVVSDLKLLMDTFHRVEFTGSWRRLFSRVKKHIIWGVLKSVTGMQGKKFKDKSNTQKELTATAAPESDLILSENDQSGKSDQAITFLKRPNDGAGDGFVTSIKGLFSNQRRKAKAFVLRTMRGEENDFSGEWSDNEAEFSPFARQMTITKTKKLIRRHTKKFRSRKGSSSQPTSPTGAEGAHYESDSSSGSPAYEEFLEENFPEMNKTNTETNKKT